MFEKAVRVFIDTEFSNFQNPELLSLGMVTEHGEEFYLENAQFNVNRASDFVKQNVITLCDFAQHGVKYSEIGLRAYEWFTNLPHKQLIVLADYHTDIDLLAEAIPGGHPKIVSARDLYLDLNQLCEFKSAVFERAKQEYYLAKSRYFNIHHARRHHALVDAIGNAFAFKHAVENMHPKYPNSLLDEGATD